MAAFTTPSVLLLLPFSMAPWQFERTLLLQWRDWSPTTTTGCSSRACHLFLFLPMAACFFTSLLLSHSLY